jgi:hypothetical protein
MNLSLLTEWRPASLSLEPSASHNMDCEHCYELGIKAGVKSMMSQTQEYGLDSGLDLKERARLTALDAAPPEVKQKRKPTAANRKYSKAFKKLKSNYMKKNGGWKKNGFKNCSKASHKMCKK